MDFEYTKEWYGSLITDDWMQQGGDRTTVAGLIEWYDSNVQYKGRFDRWFKTISMAGKCLELGFQCGKTAYWMKEKWPEITLDILDWNEELGTLGEVIKEAANINEVFLQDCQKIDKEDGYYDNIFSLDFYEHLPEEAYFNSMEEVHRLLGPEGRFFVFMGKGRHHASHINVRALTTIVNDVESKGFRLTGQRVGGPYSDVLSVFEKADG